MMVVMSFEDYLYKYGTHEMGAYYWGMWHGNQITTDSIPNGISSFRTARFKVFLLEQRNVKIFNGKDQVLFEETAAKIIHKMSGL